MKVMKKVLVSIFALCVAVSGVSAKPFIKPQVNALVDLPDEEAVIITYFGSTFLNTVLFKVNGQPREIIYDDAFAASYSQMKNFGFAIKVAPGDVTLEVYNLKQKKNLLVSGNFGKGKYEFTSEKGVIAIRGVDDGPEVPLTIREVERYSAGDGDKAVLVIDAVKEYSPVIYRINGKMPQNDDNFLVGNHCFSSLDSAQEIEIGTGEVRLDFAIYQETITKYNASLITVTVMTFKAEKGKKYKIETTHVEGKKKLVAVSSRLVEVE